MPLSLEQYASYLDTRGLPWPSAPEPDPPKAKPHLSRLRNIRAVLWNVYGTLLNVAGGELYFEHPKKLLMDVALDKTVQEFKMWGSMSRKPGQPGEYLGQLYSQVLAEQRGIGAGGGGERYPEIAAERVWEALIKKLLFKDYQWDTGFFGALNEFSRKVAYFFHASLQGSACYPGAPAALRSVHDAGLAQGLLGDGQCFTAVQLQRGLTAEEDGLQLDELIPADLHILSYDTRSRKPSERLFRKALDVLEEKGIEPEQTLHVGSRLQTDLAPARKLGMKTALFAGDRNSLQATPEKLKDSASRPDVLLTKLDQIAEVIAS